MRKRSLRREPYSRAFRVSMRKKSVTVTDFFPKSFPMAEGGFICPHCKKYTARSEPRCIHCGKYVGSPLWAAVLRRIGGTEHPGTKLILGLCILAYGVSVVVSVQLAGGKEVSVF